MIGSGRVIIRGSNRSPLRDDGEQPPHGGPVRAEPAGPAEHGPSRRRRLIRIEQAARVTGAVHADGKAGSVARRPDFDTNALVNGLLCDGRAVPAGPTVTACWARWA